MTSEFWRMIGFGILAFLTFIGIGFSFYLSELGSPTKIIVKESAVIVDGVRYECVGIKDE